ncbi:unnamed protein product [Urochloa humidicola]
MAAGCKAAIGCVDARAPVRASYVSLYKWPESDAEFVKSVAMARRQGSGAGGAGGQESPGGAAASASYYYYYGHNGSASMRRRAGAGGGFSGELGPAARYSSPRVVDTYSCRQMYLRSYTFSKRKETVPERTMACLGRVRERAAVFPFLPHRGGGGSTAASDAGSVGSASNVADVGRSESRDREDVGLRDRKARRSRSRRKTTKKKQRCAMVRRMQEASCGAVRAIFRHLLACTTSVDVADGGAPPAR